MEHDLSTAKVTESPPLVATIAPAAEPGAAVPAPQTPQVAKPVIQDDPKFTAFLLKDTSKVLSSFTLKPEKPGESIILRSKQTPPGTPLWTKPDENTNNCWDLFLSGKKRAGAGAPCMGVRPTGEKEYKWFSWSEIETKTRQLGLALRNFAGNDRLTFGSAAPIGVFLGTSLEFALTDAACNSRGWTVAPLYETFASDALVHILNLVDSHVVVTNPKLLPRLIGIKDRLPGLTHVVVAKAESTPDIADLAAARSAGLTVIAWGELMESGAALAVAEPLPADGKWWYPVSSDAVQTYCATSGTTGMPKVAVVTHGNWIAGIAGAEEVFLDFLNAGDKYISYLPMAHVFEKIDMYLSLRLGCCQGFFSGDVTKLFEDMESLKPRYFPTVPRLLSKFHDVVMNNIHSSRIASALWGIGFAYKRMLIHRFGWVGKTTVWDKLIFGKVQAKLGGRLEAIVVGSAPIPSELLEWYRIVLGVEVLEGYAQTENCAVSMITRFGQYYYPYGSFVGVPFRSNEIKLVDVPEMDYYTTDKPHPRGEFCARGAATMREYYKDSKKTAEAIDADGWLHSGDIAEFLPDGTVKIIDRLKNVMKLSQGEYVAIEHVENILSRSDFIMQIYLEGSSSKPYLVGIIHPDPDHTKQWASHHAHLRNLSYEDLCNSKELNDAIVHEIKQLARENELRSFEVPKVIWLEPEAFSMENDLLTPTFKNKRPQLKKKYGGKIEELYKVKVDVKG